MRKLKLFFACLLMAVLSIGQMWGGEVTFTPGTDTGNTSVTKSGVTCTLTTMNNSSYYQIFANQSGTFSVASGNITKIEFTCTASGTSKYGPGKTSANVGSYSYSGNKGTWTGEASSITLSSTAQVRMTSLTITTSGGDDPISVTGVSLDKDQIALEVEESKTLVATVSPDNATNKSVTWKSDNTNVATVVNGLVTAVGVGSTTITCKSAEDATKFATCDVTVTAAEVPTLTFDFSAQGYTNGEQYTPIYADANITITFGDGDNDGKYYNTGTAMRVYGNGHMTVAGGEGVTISKILLIFGTGDNTNAITTNGGTYADGKWTGSAQSVTFNVEGPTGHRRIKVVKVFYEAAAVVVATPTISGDENFISSTTITLTQNDADAIYYTTNGDEPTVNNDLLYSAPFSLTNSATVKAIAVKGSDVSTVAEKAFTKVPASTTIAEVQAEAESTEKSINVVISNWVVTAVSGSQVWFTDVDNTKGILLYKSGHGFEVNKKLNGEVMGTKVKLYNLYPELTSLVSADVTVTDAETITPRGTTIAALLSGHPAEQGTVVKLENVTYTSSALSDGNNSIAADNKFFNSLALVDGTEYDITGVVTYYRDGNNAVVKIAPRSADDVYAHSTVVIPTAANLAALKAAARGTYILTLSNAVVTYVNGSNAFIEDATGGALIFKAYHGFSAGDCLNGEYQVTTTDYQGKFEITAVEPQAGAATSTADIPLTTISIATLNESFSSYESRRVKIVGANVTDAISGNDRNGVINDGAVLAVYAAAGENKITLTTDDNVDIIGYPGFHNTDQQLNVWRQEDITVNEKDPAGISFTPESESITEGDPWSAPAFANPNSLDVEFSSDNESVAKVSNTGVVSLEGGYGTAIITAHTDGDANHNAGNATYTITVNEAGLDNITFDATSDVAETGELYISKAGFTLAFTGGVMDNNSEYRLYKNQTMTLSSTNYYIKKIEFTCTSGNPISGFADAEGLDKANNQWTGQANSVELTASNAQVRIEKLKVYYIEDTRAASELAWSTEEVEITLGDAFTPATLQNPNSIDASAITIESDNTDLATVNEGVVSLVANATGMAHVTATFAGNATYKPATVSYRIIVNDPTPEIITNPTMYLNFGSVEQSATINAKNLQVTLQNVAAATVAITGEGAAAFSVDETNLTGDITLHVSASSANVGTFAATLTISDNASQATAKEISLSLTVTEPVAEDDVTGTWTLVTDAATLAAGKKVIIAQYVNADGDIQTMAEQRSNNRGAVASAVAGASLTPEEGTKVFTLVAVSEGIWAFQGTDDKYLCAASSGSNHLKSQVTNDAEGQWSISIDADAKATITAQGEYTRKLMRYNPNSGNPIFSCYATNSTTGTLVALYMKEEATPEPPTPVYETVRPNLTAGNYYTVCYNKTMTAIQGASLWSFAGKDANMAYIVAAEAPYVAGTPYIIYAESDKLEAVVEEVASPVAGSNNGLYGTLSYMDADALAAAGATYMLKDNVLRPIGTNNHLDAQRAYVILDNIQGGAPANAPGKKVRGVPMQKDVTTGIDALNASETPVKMIIDGQLFIIRGEKMYNVNGQLVK